jgi:hypothetical protein
LHHILLACLLAPTGILTASACTHGFLISQPGFLFPLNEDVLCNPPAEGQLYPEAITNDVDKTEDVDNPSRKTVDEGPSAVAVITVGLVIILVVCLFPVSVLLS